jgi:molybdopterin/thiamine biosynthesis adenylyltransferase
VNSPLSSYFSRATTVPEIGLRGLKLLQASKATVVGVGGVGSAAALYLAQSGIGRLRLIDQDIVEPSNLHRLHGPDPESLYHPKAEAMAESLMRRFPWTDVEPIVETIRRTNIADLLEGSEVLVDGLDNFRTRYLLNEYSVKTATPYVFTSSIQNQGHVGLFQPPKTACLECGFRNVVDRPEESCEILGITPTITGLVGALAANETVKVMLSLPSQQLGSVTTIDGWGPWFFLSRVAKRGDCQACGRTRASENTSKVDAPAALCGERVFNVLSDLPFTIDLNRISSLIPSGEILTATNTVLVYRKNGVTVSLFRTGRVLVDGVGSEEEALRLARETRNLFTAQATPAA